MALSRKGGPYEKGGSEASRPGFGPEDLKEAENKAVGQPSLTSSSTAPGKINYSSANLKSGTNSGLSTSTSGGKIAPPGVDDGEASLYQPGALSSHTGSGRLRVTFFGSRRRQAATGGGIIGIVLAIIGFSTVAGPLQFVHISQLLTQFHFSNQQDQQDNRFLKEVRYIKYSSQGEVEKTRLGYLGNKFANTFESKLNASGYESSYSSKFGLFNGYVVDENNPKFKGKTPDEIKSIVKAETGFDIVKGETIARNPDLRGKWVIDGRKFGFFKTHALMRTMLGQAGYSKLSSVLGSRLMCARAGCSLHPMTKLSTSVKNAIENWWTNRNEMINKGAPQEMTAKKGSNPKDQQSSDSLSTATETAQSIIDEGNTAASEAKTGNQSGIELAKADMLKKAGLGGASIIGLACVIRGLADSSDQIKQAQVVMPAIRMATEFISLGSQVQSGQDINLNELAKYSGLLNGVAAADAKTGRKTSWFDAKSVQAELGKPNVGLDPSKTLTTAGTAATPFDAIKSVPFLGTACSSTVQGFITVVTLVTGTITDIALTALQGVVAGPIINDAAQWMAGQALSPTPEGADTGNQLNYGAFFAANDQAIASGGVALSPGQTAELKNNSNLAYAQDFQKQSLVSRLFNPYDSRSAVGKLVDNGGTSLGQNITKMASGIFNVGKLFSHLGSVFVPHALAASSAPYNYGIPQYGFSAEDMDNPLVDNPYQNASDVDALLSGSSGKTYIDRARKCFGVDINAETINTGKGSQQQWSVTSGQGQSPRYSDLNSSSDCLSPTDPNWLKVRFFILDTETMNSMACYQGDDQACSDIGFAGSTSDSSAANIGATTGVGSCSVTQPVDTMQYSQAQLAQIFGNPGTETSHPEMDANLVSVDFLGHSVSVNKLVAPCLLAVAQDIQASGTKYQINDMGCYRYDPNNPPANIGLRSYHTYGAACDINPSTNPFVASGAPASYDMPQSIIQAFSNHGFTWGGSWTQPKDYMHFEFHGIAP